MGTQYSRVISRSDEDPSVLRRVSTNESPDKESPDRSGCLKSYLAPVREYIKDPANRLKIQRLKLLAVAGSFAVDVLTDLNVVYGLIFNTGKKPPQYCIAGVVTGSIILPGVAVWAFLYSYAMVGWQDLVLNLLQVGLIKEFIASWDTGDKSAGFFWYTATEGNIESPANSVLTIYVLLLGITTSGHFLFFFSVLWSVMSTSRAGTDLDLYGQKANWVKYFNCFATRFCSGAVRSMSFAFFAYTTRPDVNLSQNRSFLIWVILVADFGMMLAIINLSAKNYPRLVKIFFAFLLVFASPPQCLRSFAKMTDSHRLIHAFELLIMSAVSLYLSPPWDEDSRLHAFIYGQRQPLVCRFFAASLIAWSVLVAFALANVTRMQTLAEARIQAEEQDFNACLALQQAAVQDLDPVLTGLLLVEMEDSLQRFVCDADGQYTPAKRTRQDYSYSVTVIEMLVKAGIIAFPEDEPPNHHRLLGMTVVMKSAISQCDIALLSNETPKAQQRLSNFERSLPPDYSSSWLNATDVRTSLPLLADSTDQIAMSKKAAAEMTHADDEGHLIIDNLLWHYLRLRNSKYGTLDNSEACKAKAERCFEIAGVVLDRLEGEVLAIRRHGSRDTALLWEVFRERNEECLEMMLRANASLIVFDEMGQTPLHQAATAHWKEGILLCYSRGRDFEEALLVEDTYRRTPLNCLELAHKYSEEEFLPSTTPPGTRESLHEEIKLLLTPREKQVKS